MKVLRCLSSHPFGTDSRNHSSCAVKEISSKDAGAAYLQAATETGFHRTIASLPLTPMATG